MTATVPSHDESQWTVEAGGWLRLERPRPELDLRTPGELLSLADSLGGNLRYTIQGQRAWLCGELRFPDVEVDPSAARQRLRRCALDGPQAYRADDDLVESILASGGLTWSRRDRRWVIAPAPGRPWEIGVSTGQHGVCVQAVLASWSEISEASRAGLARFLCLSQSGLRFCRAVMDDASVRIVSRVDDPSLLEAELPDSLQAVPAACCLLARGVQALLDEELARVYTSVFDEREGGGDRFRGTCFAWG